VTALSRDSCATTHTPVLQAQSRSITESSSVQWFDRLGIDEARLVITVKR
jgi:hypothetical protein